jgi:transposase
MMASRKSSKIEFSADDRAMLNRYVRRRKIARADAQRAQIILRAADGLNNCAIASAVGVTRQTVRMWRERFAMHRLDGLGDEPRCGAPRKIGDDRIEEIVTKTLEAKPASATHWSTRGMAKASGWRGRPLTDRLAIVELIGATTTKAGLKVECALDTRTYRKGIKVCAAKMAKLNIAGDDFHPEWNYTIKPRLKPNSQRLLFGVA